MGKNIAWIGLLLATFLPTMIELSSEVRQYALLLCFVALTLYLLETAFAGGSPGRMALSFLFLYLAMLTHFSGILFAAALGVYGLLRLARGRFSHALVAAWAAGQVAAAGLFVFLYRTHIVALRGSDAEKRSIDMVLSLSYFHWGRDHLLLFIFARTFGVCQFVFGQLAVGDLAGLAFVLGLVLLLRSRAAAPGAPTSRQLGLLLILPFVVNCAAALADLYPYGGTRHSSFLTPFVIAGAGFFLARLARGLLRGIGAATLVVVICQVFGVPHRPFMQRSDQNRHNMARAINAVQSQVPRGAPILVDFQSFYMIRYYLCPESSVPAYTYTSGLEAFSCGGYKVISPGPAVYLFSTDGFLPSWRELVRTQHLRPHEPAWVFEAGWDVGLSRELTQDSPAVERLDSEAFGRNIDLLKLAAGPESDR
jgi:hypothetical protein